jgi:hypothetical protein
MVIEADRGDKVVERDSVHFLYFLAGDNASTKRPDADRVEFIQIADRSRA